MATPILVTGAACRAGGIGRTITGLLLKQGKAVRAMVRNEDQRAQASRDTGAEVMVGDLLVLEAMHRVIAARFASPPPHLGTIGHPTGPQSENRHCDAQEYAKAHGRMITCQDMPAEPWRDGLLERGSPVHPVNHLATMAELRRAGRYDAAVHDALYCAKICAYAQGFQLLRAAQPEYGWELDLATIASIWRGGCIIRARFLQQITDAYKRDPGLVNLLLDPYVNAQIQQGQP